MKKTQTALSLFDAEPISRPSHTCEGRGTETKPTDAKISELPGVPCRPAASPVTSEPFATVYDTEGTVAMTRFSSVARRSGFNEYVTENGVLSADNAIRFANSLLGRPASKRPVPTVAEWTQAAGRVCPIKGCENAASA